MERINIPVPQKARWSGLPDNGARNFLILLARPDGFEPPTTWFEVRPEEKWENFDVYMCLIFINFARGVSVAKSPKSTTKHY
jgi:hypothetical protein